MLRQLIRVAATIVIVCLSSAVNSQSKPLYWRLQSNALFAPSFSFKNPSGETQMTLSGRSLAALVDVKERIAQQYGIQPELLVTNQGELNAFAAEQNGRALIVVNAETVRALGDDRDLWAALMGHELGHLHHHHSAAGQSRSAVIGIIAALLNANEARHGKDRTELINFGASLVNNAFTRDQEREADATGLQYMVNAGYNPTGAIRLQELLVSRYGSTGVLSFLQSHPSGSERIQNLRRQMSSLPAVSRDTRETSISVDELDRQVVLCNADSKGQSDNATKFRMTMECLQKSNPEFARRWALCQTDLFFQKDLNKGTFDRCAGESPSARQFSSVAWANYCKTDVLIKGIAANERSMAQLKCEFENDEKTALRGQMCMFEGARSRTPQDQRATFLLECSTDSTGLQTRFDRDTWNVACRRKGQALASGKEEKERLERECMAEAPPDLYQKPLMTNLSAAAILDEVGAALKVSASKKATVIQPPISECDRLASMEDLPGVKLNYWGFIDGPAAERECLAAIKSTKTTARFQRHLAGVLAQQGRFAEAADLINKELKKNPSAAASAMGGYLIGEGLGVSKDSPRAFKLLFAAAKMGSTLAIGQLGLRILKGDELPKDPQVALALFQLAADRGDRAALAEIAAIKLSGREIEQDTHDGMRRMRDALSDDYPLAYAGLGIAIKSDPTGNQAEVSDLLAKAFEKTKRYADSGSIPARVHLASMYANGIGVSRNVDLAFSLYREAAEINYPPALMGLAFAHLNGTGTSKDKDKAAEYFAKASELGSRDAAVQLGRLGKGAPSSQAESKIASSAAPELPTGAETKSSVAARTTQRVESAPALATSRTKESDSSRRLRELKDLAKDGVITKEEFEAKKRDILKSM